MSHDHRTTHTSGHTVLYGRNATNTVQVRIMHGQGRPDMVCMSIQNSCMINIRTQQKTQLTYCCHLETTEYLLIMPPKKRKVSKRIPMEDSPSENTKKATKALRSLQPVDSIDPSELEEPLAPPDEIPTDSD